MKGLLFVMLISKHEIRGG